MRGGQDPGRQYTFLFIAPHVVRRCKDVLYEWVPEGGIDENSQLPALQAKLAEMQDRVQGLAVIFRVVSKCPSRDLDTANDHVLLQTTVSPHGACTAEYILDRILKQQP